jgi:hypothetical protein
MMVQIMHSSNPSQMEATKMAQAHSSLSPFRPISQSAVHVLALMAAKKVVREQMRDEGRRVTLIPPAEINVKARAYLDQHPELLAQAEERARLMRLWEKQPKRPRPRQFLEK